MEQATVNQRRGIDEDADEHDANQISVLGSTKGW
jgi:hypothetical protein